MVTSAPVRDGLNVRSAERELSAAFVAGHAGQRGERVFHPRRVEQRRGPSGRRVDREPFDAAAGAPRLQVVRLVDPSQRCGRRAAEIHAVARVVDGVDA